MNEGRRSKILLLDGQLLDILIQPRLLVSELLNIIASHISLKDPDKQYFGIAYIDTSGTYHWLNRDKKVLDFDFPRKSAHSDEPINLTHNIQFFVNSIFSLGNVHTITLFFVEAVNQLNRGSLKLCFADFAVVYANLLQYYFGDYESEQSALELVQKTITKNKAFYQQFEKHANECDEEVTNLYGAISGLPSGQALVNVMTRIERSPTYGSRFYVVRDKSSAVWSLGINNWGISQYDPSDLLNSKKDFLWSRLEKIYIRDKKFTIEIRDLRRTDKSSEKMSGLLDGMDDCDDDLLAEAVNHPTTQVSLSRRALQPSSSLHVFYSGSPLLCESLWSAATAQHQFFLDQATTTKSEILRHKHKVEGVVRDLTVKRERVNSQSSFGSSLPSLSSLTSCTSSLGMPAAKVADGSSASLPSVQSTYNQLTDDERKRNIEKYKALKAKKDELEDKLIAKLDELRSVCINEGELIGEMPKEIYKTLIPGEPEPKLKRRVGTAFKFSAEILSQCSLKADKLDQMEADVELHRKLVAAAERLAKEKSMNKSLRKKRRKELEAASQKLKGLELGLNQLRLSSSKPDVSSAGMSGSCNNGRAWPNFSGHPCSTKAGGSLVAKSCPTTPRGSIPDLYTDNELCDRDEEDGARSVCNAFRSHTQRTSPKNTHSGVSVLPPMAPGRRPTEPAVKISSSPFPSDELDNPLNIRSPSLHGFENVGYQTSASYKSSYRQSNFPTLQTNSRFIRAQSEHSLRQESPQSLLSEERSIKLKPSDHSKISGLRLYDSSATPSSWSAPSGVQVGSEVKFAGDSADERLNRWASRMPNHDNRRVDAIPPPATTVAQMSTSHSFSGAFATSSLDRRALKIRQSSSSQLPANTTLHSTTDVRRDNGQRFESSTKTTTFPVTQHGSIKESYKPLEKPDVMRYHSNTLSATRNLLTTKPPPRSYVSRFSESTLNNTSSSRLPGATDPKMEALLHYYKDADSRKSTKTATIV